MLVKRLESLERRLIKTMARDEASKKKYELAYSFVKAALDAANEDDNQAALDNMMKFNTIMQEYKLNHNV